MLSLIRSKELLNLIVTSGPGKHFSAGIKKISTYLLSTIFMRELPKFGMPLLEAMGTSWKKKPELTLSHNFRSVLNFYVIRPS